MQGKTKRVVRSSVHKPTQKCTQLNEKDPVHVTKCGVKVCHHHQTGLLCATCTVYVSVVHKNMPYDGVQVYIYATIQVCAQVSHSEMCPDGFQR